MMPTLSAHAAKDLLPPEVLAAAKGANYSEMPNGSNCPEIPEGSATLEGDVFRITLPLPDRSVSAHNKGHWRSKAKAIKAMRAAAERVARWQAPPEPWTRASLAVLFLFPDRRTRDAMNFGQMAKPYVDGVVDAGVITDDRWTVLSPVTIDASVDSDRPRVEITLTQVLGT